MSQPDNMMINSYLRGGGTRHGCENMFVLLNNLKVNVVPQINATTHVCVISMSCT